MSDRLSRLDALIESYRDEMVGTACQVLSYESVRKPASAQDEPFGPGVAGALRHMLEAGRAMGLSAQNLDGFAGHLEASEGLPLVAILAHIDVVPAGNGWTMPPFAGTVRDGRLYGRGAEDNKGPAVASLYALRAAWESGCLEGVRARLILGADEESDWECMKRYFETEEKPDLAFTPDAAFPVMAGEKGILALHISWIPAEGDATGIGVGCHAAGGTAINMVPDRCTVSLVDVGSEVADLLSSFAARDSAVPVGRVEVQASSDAIAVTAHGRASHGSMPEEGANAIAAISGFLCRAGEEAAASLGRAAADAILPGPLGRALRWVDSHVGSDVHDGSRLGIAFSHRDMGRLTVNAGLLECRPDADGRRAGTATVSLDIRFPLGASHEAITRQIAKTLPEGAVLRVQTHMEPIYSEPGSPLVTALSKAWADVTGQETLPVYMAGTTYAKAIPNCEAFGALFPGAAILAHQADEYWDIDDMVSATKIFARALAGMAAAVRAGEKTNQ